MKSIITAFLCLVLGACGTLSADYESERTGLFSREPIKVKRQSKEKALSDSQAKAIKSVSEVEIKRIDLKIAEQQNIVTCNSMSTEELIKLPDAVAISYLEGVTDCAKDSQLFAMMNNMVATFKDALGAKSDLALVAEAYERQIKHVSTEGTRKIGQFTKPITDLFKVKIVAEEASGAIQNGQNAQRDQGIAASENNTSISVGTVSTSQNPEASSVAGAGGPGGGEGAPGGLGGPSTGTATTTKDGDTIIIGNRNEFNNVISQDEGQSFISDENILNNEESATGTLQTEGVKNNGFQNADDNGGSTNQAEDPDGFNL